MGNLREVTELREQDKGQEAWPRVGVDNLQGVEGHLVEKQEQVEPLVGLGGLRNSLPFLEVVFAADEAPD